MSNRGKILNPSTGRYVKRNGKVGKKILGGWSSGISIPQFRVSNNYSGPRGGNLNPKVANWKMSPLNASYNDQMYMEKVARETLNLEKLGNREAEYDSKKVRGNKIPEPQAVGVDYYSNKLKQELNDNFYKNRNIKGGIISGTTFGKNYLLY